MSLFVTLEGIDGAGKSTLAGHLHRTLEARGVEAVLTKEPTGTWLGEAVRRAVAEEVDPRVQTLLFLADRTRHVEEIQAWLSQGRVVVCDRYHDSTVAYQGVALEGHVPRPMEWIRTVASPLIVKPDVTFLLVVDPKEGLSRLSAVRSRSPFERPGYLEKVQERYLELATKARFVRLDASRPPEVLAREALAVVRSRLQG